jgi:CelD/BcsL family acetyltransferase involved in cellulose biosynthesis
VNGSPTEVRVLSLDEVKDTDVERWADLATRTLEPHPFLHPDFLLPSRRWFGGERTDLVVVERDGRWRAVLPLTPRERFPGTPLRWATTASRFLDARAPLLAPFVDAEDAPGTLDALFRHLSSRTASTPPLLELTQLPDDGALHDLLGPALARRHVVVQERSRYSRAYALAGPDRTVDGHLSSGRRKQVRRFARRLEEELGGALELVDLGGSSDAVDAFRELRSRGWKGRQDGAGTVPSDGSAWFSEATGALGRRGMLRVLALRAGGTTVFMSVVLQAGDVCFGLTDTYDESFAASSPGVIGRLREAHHLVTSPGVRAFDPCLHPRYAQATALYPDRRVSVGLLLATRGTARHVLRARPALSAVRRSTRTAVGEGRAALRGATTRVLPDRGGS